MQYILNSKTDYETPIVKTNLCESTMQFILNSKTDYETPSVTTNLCESTRVDFVGPAHDVLNSAAKDHILRTLPETNVGTGSFKNPLSIGHA